MTDEEYEAVQTLIAAGIGVRESSRELQAANLQYLHKYQDLVDGLSDDILRLPKAMDKLAQLKATRLWLVVSVAVASAVVGLLAIWWAAGQSIGFPHDLLEAVGAALITFTLVEVFLHWLIGIPSRAVQQAASAVQKVKESAERATQASQEYLEAAKRINADLEADLKTWPEA